jgi:hypothetical protein
MGGGNQMQVLRDFRSFKQMVNKNYNYTCVGFTKSNLFNITHEHLYNQSALTLTNPNQKLFGTVWDNDYDVQIFANVSNPIPSTSIDEQLIIDWFAQKGFEYLFIPPESFMATIMNLPIFPQLKAEIEDIWVNENYNKYLSDWARSGNTEWIKMVLLRHYLIFSSRFEKLINRTHQLIAPDGTFGLVYIHFLKKYCGGEFPIVPLLRNEDGTPYDIKIIKTYPQHIKNKYAEIVPFFRQFDVDKDLDKLINSVTACINKSGKNVEYPFLLESFDYFHDEVTMNGYVFKMLVRGSTLRDNGDYDHFRLWEYSSEF